jgi:hypothetical protein
LHLVFAVWSTDTPFSETHYPWEPSHAEGVEAVVTAEEAAVPDQSLIAADAPSLPVPSTAEQAISPTPAESHGDGKEMAAGHKRESSPQKKVVTATPSSVELPTVVVNKRNSKRGTIDYAFLREQVTMRQVLQHLGFLDRMRGRDSDLRGPCPIHGSQSPASRSFSANLTKNVFSCHNTCCRAAGNVLDLWAAVHKLPLYEAACHMADTFNASLTRGEQQRRGARNKE